MSQSHRHRCLFVLPFALVLTPLSRSTAADWPELRGPDGQGRTVAPDLPLHWSEDKNVAWKVSIPGKG